MEPWRVAIKNHRILMKERADIAFWSENIIDATAHLTEDIDWKKFYLYLTQSPRFFNEEDPQIVETLGELETLPTIPDYREDQDVEIVHNGPCEQYIMVNTKIENSDDEKTLS